MPRPKASVRPVRLRLPSGDLATTIVRTIGYRAVCTCGFRSRTWARYGEARAESRWHAGQHELEHAPGQKVPAA